MRPATIYNPGVNRMQAEFIPANFGPHKYELQIEESIGAVPPYNSKTSKMNDPGPPKQMRVKSGYTGHVPHGRDFIGGTYCSHDNRGTASKDQVPVMHSATPGKHTGYPIPVKAAPSPGSPGHPKGAYVYSQDPFSSKPGDLQHDYGVTTTAPVAARIEKVLAADYRDMSDADNRVSAFDKEGAGQWIMAGYTGHVRRSPQRMGSNPSDCTYTHAAVHARCVTRKQSAARAACTLSRARDDLTTMCALPIVIGGQGSRSLRHFILRPARGSELPRPLLHLRYVRAAGQLQQGGDRPLSLRRMQSCTLLRCQSSMLLHHVAAPRRGGVQRALFFFFALIFLRVRDFRRLHYLCAPARDGVGCASVWYVRASPCDSPSLTMSPSRSP